MRDRYRIYACPQPGCPKVGRGILARCTEHGDVEMVPIIVRREVPDADKISDEARRNLDALRSRGDAGKRIADQFEKIARDLGMLR